MSGFKVPRAKKTPLEKQVKEICKLLLLWPEAPGKVVEQFIRSKFGIEMTRACLQEAKALLQIHQPEYTEAVLTKQWFTRYVVHHLISLHGIGGLTDAMLISKVRQQLTDKFEENTQERLLKKWVFECTSDIANLFGDADKINKLREEARTELIKLKVLDSEANRSFDLI